VCSQCSHCFPRSTSQPGDSEGSAPRQQVQARQVRLTAGHQTTPKIPIKLGNLLSYILMPYQPPRQAKEGGISTKCRWFAFAINKLTEAIIRPSMSYCVKQLIVNRKTGRKLAVGCLLAFLCKVYRHDACA
jgi:hypothetical protein